MAKKKNNLLSNDVAHETRSKYKKTSIGGRPSTSMMNKKKRQGRNRKQLKNRGQGKWQTTVYLTVSTNQKRNVVGVIKRKTNKVYSGQFTIRF